MSRSTNNIDWKLFYTGSLDLKTFKERQSFVECRLTESGDITKILNNIDTKYRVNMPSRLVIKQRNDEYECNYDTKTTVTNLQDGIPATNLFTERVYSGSNAGYRPQFFNTLITAGDKDRFKNIVLNASNYYHDTDPVEDLLSMTPYTIYRNGSENSEVSISISQVMKIYRSFTEDGTGLISLLLTAMILNENNEVSSVEDIISTAGFNYDATSPLPLGTVAFNSTASLSNILKTNESLLLFIRCEHTLINPSNGYSNVGFRFDPDGEMTINATEYKTNTIHRSISTSRLLNRLIYSCINNESPTTDPAYDYLDSTLFEEGSRYGRTYFTDGLSLRTGIIPGIDGAMVISLREVFNALNVPFCLGMGLEQRGDNAKLLFDHRSVFFNPTVKLELGEVKGLTEEFDMKIVFNSLGIEYSGADSQDYENGIHEYLKKTIYTLPTNYVDNALENSSNVKVDGTSIEKLRTNQTIFTQESLQDDDTNYMIRCIVDGGVVYSSQGEEFDTISQTGLQNNTQLFNVDMYAPITMRFWSWLISAGLQYNVSTDEIVIQKSEPDIDVAITIDGVLCDRNNITLTKLHQLAELQPFPNAERPLFDPILYRFTAPMNEDNINLFKAYRHYAISFTYKGKEYKGFAMKIPSLPRKESEFILLKLSKFAENV